MLYIYVLLELSKKITLTRARKELELIHIMTFVHSSHTQKHLNYITYMVLFVL